MEILYNPTVQIGDNYGPSLNAAFAQLRTESGIIPLVLAPYGGTRTPAQETAIHGPADSDHVKQRAVDINNQRIIRNWNEPRFLIIMSAHGWYNMTVTGQPFPTEPWHFATHSTTPTDTHVQPLPNKETTMFLIQSTTSRPDLHTNVAPTLGIEIGSLSLIGGTRNGAHRFTSADVGLYTAYIRLLGNPNPVTAEELYEIENLASTSTL